MLVIQDQTISTGVVLPESYEEARRAGGLGDRPLIVLAAGRPIDFGNPELNRQAAAYQQVWIHEMQAGLARLSTRGREIVFEDSDHNIPPDVVVNAVRDIVGDVRAEGTKANEVRPTSDDPGPLLLPRNNGK